MKERFQEGEVPVGSEGEPKKRKSKPAGRNQQPAVDFNEPADPIYGIEISRPVTNFD